MPDRDVLVPKEPPANVRVQTAQPVRDVIDDDFTGQHLAMPEKFDRDQLREARRSRTPSERMDRLEDKHDDVVADVAQIRVDMGHMKGSLEGMAKSLDSIASRDHVAFTARVDVDTAKAIAAVDVSKATAIAEAKDAIRERASKREARRKLVMALLKAGAAVVVVAAVHKILQLWVPWL